MSGLGVSASFKNINFVQLGDEGTEWAEQPY